MYLPRAIEDYLKSILILQNKNGTVRSLDVARMLHVTKPSVSRAMKVLREGGYLTMDEDNPDLVILLFIGAAREIRPQ